MENERNAAAASAGERQRQEQVLGDGPPVMELERALPLMAGRSVALAFEDQALGGAVIVRTSGDRRDALGRIARPDRMTMLRNGWIEPGGADGLWRLSAAGRDAVRRLRSGTSLETVSAYETTQARPPTRPVANPAESPLGWLRTRKGKDGQPLLGQLAFDAGERLRRDFEFAQMRPRVTASWNPVGSSSGYGGTPGAGVAISDGAAAAGERVRRALAAVGPELSGMLVDVRCHLQGIEAVERSLGLPRRSGKVILEIALMALARHYRMPGAERPADTGAGLARHWGAEGYRPPLGFTRGD